MKTRGHPTDVVVKPRDLMPETAYTLPARFYVDPVLFRREMERLFARMWICAGRLEQIDSPGRFFLREILGEPIVITRSQSGVRAFFNVCRHHAAGHWLPLLPVSCCSAAPEPWRSGPIPRPLPA